MDLYIGDFVIKQHYCLVVYRQIATYIGPYIIEITYKQVRLGKAGNMTYKKYQIGGKCIVCGMLVEVASNRVSDNYKKIDKEAGRFIKCLLA